MASDRVLNVALVGYGFAGQTFHAPVIAAVPGLRLHSVVSGDAAKVLRHFPGMRVSPTLDAALDDAAIELVVIATPNDTHAPLAHAALARGRHVVVDKPFALTLAEADGVMAHARAAGRIVSVFQNRRWDADFLALKAVLAAGTLGEIVQFESHFDRWRPGVRDRWRERAVPGAGIWFDLGPHLVDQALQLFGTPEAVFADLGEQREGAQATDYVHVLLRYRALRVILHATCLAAVETPRLVAMGLAGSFVARAQDPQEAALKRCVGNGGDPWATVAGDVASVAVMAGERRHETMVGRMPGDYRCFYAAMRDAIAGIGPPPVTEAEALDVMRVLDCGLASSRSRAEVAFPAA